MIEVRGWVMVTVAVLATSPGSVSAQADVDVERLVHRIERVVERAAVRMDRIVARAFDGGSWRNASVVSEQESSFDWSGRVEAGEVVEIKGVNGAIFAGPASGDEVEVRALKSARRSDPDEVRIEVVEHRGGVTVCSVYPTPRGERANECAPGEEGRMSTRRNDVEVRFEVRVPDGVLFVGRTVNGDIEATTSGFAEAETVNGSIRARMEGRPFGRGVRFSTVNGNIDLDLPDDVDADVDAEWVNGGLETDLPFQIRGRLSRHRATGTLGDGGPPLALETVNGSIRIR